MEVVQKVWGFEKWIANSELYCGKLLVVNPGRSSSLHYHKLKTETFFVYGGMIVLELEGEYHTLGPGDAITILPGQKHRFTCTSLMSADVFEFSTEHFDSDSYRLEEAK